MKLLTSSDFDLCFDIKNLPDLEYKIQQYQNTKDLLDLMYNEIVALNRQLSRTKLELNCADPDGEFSDLSDEKLHGMCG